MIYYLIDFINRLFQLYNFLILIRVIFSWVDASPYNPVVQFIYKVTEPILAPFRGILKIGGMGFDFSPIIAYIVLEFLRRGIINLLIQLVH